MVGGCNASLAAPLIPPIPTDPHPSQPPNGNRNDDHTQHNYDHDQFYDDLIKMIIIIILISLLFIEQTEQIPSLTAPQWQS